ncbi:BTB/POZ domain-containing protein Btb3 [Trichophyton interdigitale]|uniref:BTB/POZ domain-containing protein Btb3 n=1 Tax=Trichophyton interdigitale TaxID=101480 RepID=A0A9P4YIG8_9EURO|nr:BTB/POZ domain-containing protein Btb3 [Trichophyton interdigitale]KAG5210088.1 BTB/POZ domain-containing protein Btb3 [Trichophyton interdigitale]KAG8209018.1 BTB/POZ domain-containing protein Btb3 [Trichophyton interdigitale]
MSESQVLRKDQLETSLFNERKLIGAGELKEDNPLDLSEPFRELCEACRRGDLKACQEKITEGVNINGRDLFDCTPLILASLCGHYEVVQLLLDSGALCERDTFQGERCLYNALNSKIRNLLLEYDYSKSTDPLQPFASHITSLLSRDHPQMSDIAVTAGDETFHLHKFILSARSPYFHKKLSAAPEATSWKLPSTIPPPAFSAGIRYLYLGDAPRDLRSGPGAGLYSEAEVFEGIDRIANHLELRGLVDTILDSGDKRLTRQRRSDEVSKGRNQMEAWFRENIIKHKVVIDMDRANEVKWSRDNSIFADVLLRADEDDSENEDAQEIKKSENGSLEESGSGIPIGGFSRLSLDTPMKKSKRKSVLFPAHRAMLLRSEFFSLMFSSSFREAQVTDYLQIIPIDCSPDVLEIVLTFLYTEKADFPLEIAVDVLFAADLLLIERLKTKAAVLISTLGSGNITSLSSKPSADTKQSTSTKGGKEAEGGDDIIDIYEILRAGWLMRIQRLEEFAARYFAYRLEAHIDNPEFAQLVKESAERIQKRQETDSIELVDDIRYYLSERFRLRFEDSGIDILNSESNPNEGDLAENTNTPSNSSPETNSNGNIISPTPLSPPPSSFNRKPSDANSAREQQGDKVVNSGPPKIQANGKSEQTNASSIIRTLDGREAGDEFSRDAIDYELLLNKLDQLLEKLGLDA